ncbi:MAG TPA: hypothetical protein VMW27_29485 [Thermoanaerobaculia bacterium]|nr:hypothetical protein [Thermoanaerobaculia bacterium]
MNRGTPVLTPEEFEALLALLSPDREEAGMRYEILRGKLIRFFHTRGCDRPEELADATFNRVAQKLKEGVEIRASDPAGYFYGVAYHIYQEYLRSRQREQKVQESPDLLPDPPEDSEPDPRLDILQDCLGELSADEQRLVLQYHQGEDNIRRRKELCRETGIPTLNALRIRVYRLRRKLEECVLSKLVQ